MSFALSKNEIISVVMTIIILFPLLMVGDTDYGLEPIPPLETRGNQQQQLSSSLNTSMPYVINRTGDRCSVLTNVKDISYLEQSVPPRLEFKEIHYSYSEITERVQRGYEELESTQTTTSYRSVDIVVTIPSVWSRTETIDIQYDIYLVGYYSAYFTLAFTSYDEANTQDQEICDSKSVHLTDYHNIETLTVTIPKTSIGLKEAEVYGNAYYDDGGITPYSSDVGTEIAGSSDYISYTDNTGYTNIQRYGAGDWNNLLPPSDDMTTASNNPDYYWEGMSDDGFNIPTFRRLYHPEYYGIYYQAAIVIDDFDYFFPPDVGRFLNGGVNNLMTPVDDSYTHYTTNADKYSKDRGWEGLCDEFAIVFVSFCRSVGIPARYIYASGVNTTGHPRAHAWAEFWDGYDWIHADPTWDVTDNPQCYQNVGISWNTLKILAEGDDAKYSDDDYDQLEHDGRLHYFWDFEHRVNYDGSNNY